MRRALQRHGLLVAIAAVFLALFALLAPSTLSRDQTRDHSAFRKNAWGCAALAELCRVSRPPLQVELLTTPMDDLRSVDGLLLVLDPKDPFSDAELYELVRWVESGGVLVAAFDGRPMDLARLRAQDQSAAQQLAEALGVELVALEERQLTAVPASGSSLAPGARQVAISTHFALSLPGLRARTALAAEGRPIVASFRRGQGHVFVASDAEMLANARLAQADNVAFVANLLWGHAPGGRVYFDEFHHGFGGPGQVRSPTDPAPLTRALIGTAIGLGLFLFGKSVRFGRAIPLPDNRRRAASEYVEAMAGLFRRGEAGDWALAQIAASSRARLAAAVGLPACAEPETLAASLSERRGVPAEATLALLQETAASAGRMKGSQLLALVSRLTQLEARVIRPAR